MGLAGPRKRVKLAHDPNNTKWTRDTGSFGHKIMAAQGWQPGEYLGAKNAAHSEHFTAANASHIRVVLKDDNLGLGAKKGSGQGAGECTGLDVFKNLLGRLNGRDEDEMEAERQSKEDLRNAIYAERKWGSIRFVSGGFLVGDKIQDLIDQEADRVRDLALDKKADISESSSDSESESEEEKPAKEEKREKKRKADDTEEDSSERSRKKEKKSKKSKDKSKDKSDKKSKDKSKKRSKSEVEDSDEESSGSAAKKSKKDKKEKKEKEDKKSKRSKKSKSVDVSDDDSDSTSKKSKKEKKEKRKDKESGSGSKTPVSGTATPDTPAVSQMLQGRHAVRARNIAQKRMAVMDMAQLNQIFMIKS